MANDDGRSYDAGRFGGAHSSVGDWSEYQRGQAERAAWDRQRAGTGATGPSGGSVPVGGADASAPLAMWLLWQLLVASACLFFVAIPTVPAAVLVHAATRTPSTHPRRSFRQIYTTTFGGMLIYTLTVGFLFAIAKELPFLNEPWRLGFDRFDWAGSLQTAPAYPAAILTAHLLGVLAFNAILRPGVPGHFEGFLGYVKALLLSGIAVVVGYGSIVTPFVVLWLLS